MKQRNSTVSLAERLRHGLIPAVPVTFRKNGTINEAAHERYVAWMRKQSIAGIALWAHTGRGLFLTKEQRDYVITSWRTALPDKPIIAGVGGSPHVRNNEQFLSSARVMAEQAIRGGADAMLVYAPTIYRKLPDKERYRAILHYHKLLASYDIPLILFYLYEAAGGINYSDSLLDRLLALPNVVGIKIATLDSVSTFQSIAQRCKEIFPEKLIITGEDRFFGYTLMCGADAALVGMGSVYCTLQADMMKAYYNGNARRFVDLSIAVDQLGQASFGDPVELYIRRLLFILAEQKIISVDGLHDIGTKALSKGEVVAIRRWMKGARLITK